VALKKGSNLRYVSRNHLTGTALITDTSESQVGSIKFYPYGSTWSSTGTIDTERKFTGQRLDSATGLYYYGARYYDPGIGRFISADTIVPDFANPQSLNRYTYVLNNPLKYTDPTGMQEESTFPEEEEYLAGDLSEELYQKAYTDWKEAYYASVGGGAKVQPSSPGAGVGDGSGGTQEVDHSGIAGLLMIIPTERTSMEMRMRSGLKFSWERVKWYWGFTP
jgi:RHS repeat-associated protein